MEAPRINSVVRIRGTSRQDLDGQQGRVCAYCAATDRYTVLLANDKHVALRSEHLEVCSAEIEGPDQPAAASPQRSRFMVQKAAFDEYTKCMQQALMRTMCERVKPSADGPSATKEYGKAARIGAVVGCTWGAKLSAVALRLQVLALLRMNDPTAARIGRGSLTCARFSGSRSRLVEALACCATVSKAFPAEIIREEQQAAAADRERRARLEANAAVDPEGCKLKEAQTELLRNSTRSVWADRRPRALPPPDVWGEGQVDLGALPHLPPSDQWTDANVTAAAEALSQQYFAIARKICHDADAAAARPGAPPADDDAHVPDYDAHCVLANCYDPRNFGLAGRP
jgi:hypothetical protein